MALAENSALRRVMGYEKFRGERLSIAVLNSGYHLQAECSTALRRLGHHVVPIGFTEADQASTVMKALLTALVQARPDFVLSINHLGFDAGGTMGAVLEELQMPVAVWYVDSPFFVLRQAKFPAAAVTSLFVWEQRYVGLLQAMRCEDVHYLPLACDMQSMTPALPPPPAPGVTFVGDSMAYAQRKWSKRLNHRQRLRAQVQAAALTGDRQALLPLLRHGLGELDTLAAAAFFATASYRNAVLREVPQACLQLYGDVGWEKTMPEACYHGAVKYGRDLAAVYASAEILLNATSLQMPSAVNQRVFDVPVAGGFVISDAQADMNELFTPGHDAVVYGGLDELRDKIAYYRVHESVRRLISQRARVRIAAEHTYAHRLQTMLRVLRARHAASRGARITS